VQGKPLSYSIDPDNEFVTIVGDFSNAEGWQSMLNAIASDPLYKRGFSFIRDLRDSAYPVDVATVSRIIAVVDQFWSVLGAHRAAIVMGPTHQDPALVAHALAEYHHLPIRAFTSFDDAVAWVRQRH
jgi:hypothetical protein